MHGSRPTWLLLLGLALLSLPGCCMIGFGCCSVDVEFELAAGDSSEWTARGNIKVAAVLIDTDNEGDWVGPFETRSDLARWMRDELDDDPRRDKGRLELWGRLKYAQLDVSEPRGKGVQRGRVELDPGDIEPLQGTLLVFANYRKPGDLEGVASIELPLTEACLYGVRLQADGEFEDISDEVRAR